MLPNLGSFAMRLLSKRQLKELVLYSPQHIQRLENDNRFPKRVRLGNGVRARVGWIESEVLDWLQKRIDARDKPTDAS
jgi:prophage regulatory protein